MQPNSVLDYVARHSPQGMPPHSLKIKLHAVFRLLRNFSIDLGSVKNTRVVIVGMGDHLITVRILRGIGGVNSIEGEDILIPRISFSSVLPSGHTLLRRQFPLIPAYATTFNSCQGLTLDHVGVDLTRDVFSHGQLYTALSRIRNCSHACVQLRSGELYTNNVTYKELLLPYTHVRTQWNERKQIGDDNDNDDDTTQPWHDRGACLSVCLSLQSLHPIPLPPSRPPPLGHHTHDQHHHHHHRWCGDNDD
jgi:hypothetical protein